MFLRGSPIYEFHFGNREGESFGACDTAEGVIVTLKELYVPFVGRRRDCDHKVINVGENHTLGDYRREGGYVDDKKQRGDGGALWGTVGSTMGLASSIVFLVFYS